MLRPASDHNNIPFAYKDVWEHTLLRWSRARLNHLSSPLFRMKSITLSVVLFCLQASSLVNAHWYLSCFGQGNAGCTEGASMNPFHKESGDNGLLQTAPIAPADSNPLMKCGTVGIPTQDVAPIPVSPGASMTAQWLHDTGVVWDTRMNANHHGFANIHLAPYSTGNNGQSAGEGAVWTKIYSEGLYPTTQANKKLWSNPANTDSCTTGDVPADQCTVVPFVGWWATDRLRMAQGKMPFKLPSSVPNGKYVIRGELLTTWLPDTVSTAQGYIACSVIQVGSATEQDQSASLPKLSGKAIDIPADYASSTWMTYDLHSKWINGADQPPPDLPSNPGGEAWTGGDGTVSADTPQTDTIEPAAEGPVLPPRRRHRRSHA